ncbi:monooxygenase [Kineosporia sp. NBRC 101677]|uniref:FAD-dependent monooxygenase n=1 Tax=Kineosporia sp. NBRC 101677 TaxID=3032197 RepID=UPI0024A2B969|nr:FAD-dependent monooxygenase [Kineosporia sp. NBRC 101677]GLY19529.1 monooxygenase [Kineosporia sp. NBRC 101677]
MTRRAIVIGGGIGGLTAAAALGRQGWQVTVHERNPVLPDTGTALGIWPQALRALHVLGLDEQIRKAGRRQEAGAFLRPDGSPIARFDLDRMRRRAGDDVYLVPRPALLSVLHRAAVSAGAQVLLGRPVGHFEGFEADLVVVADGVFSQAREHLFGPAHRARYSGTTAWRGVVEGMSTDSFTEVWGPGLKFGVTPHDHGRTNWYAAATAAPASQHPGHELPTLREMYEGWAHPVSRVLDSVKEAHILRHDIYVTPPLPSYVRGSTALIGDAAHAMTPDLGRGACESIIDAVTLAECVSGGTLSAGLGVYDRRRRPTTQRLARMAALAGWVSRVGHGRPVRDGLLRVSMLAGPPS